MLESIFPSMWMFIVTFVVVYGILTIIIGWQDMKRGSYHTESTLTFDKHPRMKDQYDAIVRIEKRLDEIEKKLRK